VSGLQQNIQIKYYGLPSDVVHIEDNTPPIVRVIPTGNLPKSGDTGLSLKIAMEVPPISEQLLPHYRPWAYQTHLPSEHVPQLR
jgi:hypothetical protein